jgi:hypothetical protein
MENKTSGLTKLILIVESSFLVIALVVFYGLKSKLQMPDNFLWLWFAIMVFSAASFLFLFIVFIIALFKRSLRTAFWAPLLLLGFMVFLVITLLMFTCPSIMAPVFLDSPGQEIITEAEIIEQADSSQMDDKTQHQQVEPEASSEPIEFTIYNIGDLIEIGDIKVKINGVRITEKEEWDNQLEEGYVYLLVDTFIENTGSEEIYIDTYNNFRLVDKDGRNYSATYNENAKGRVDGPLNSGRKIAGELVYGIPQDIKEFEIEVNNPNQQMLTSGMVLISIVLE